MIGLGRRADLPGDPDRRHEHGRGLEAGGARGLGDLGMVRDVERDRVGNAAGARHANLMRAHGDVRANDDVHDAGLRGRGRADLDAAGAAFQRDRRRRRRHRDHADAVMRRPQPVELPEGVAIQRDAVGRAALEEHDRRRVEARHGCDGAVEATGQPKAQERPSARVHAPRGHGHENNPSTGSAWTSSRGWLRWFITIVCGSIPSAW